MSHSVNDPRGTDGLVELAPRGLQFVDHPKLEVSNLFKSKFFGVLSKPHRKSIDVVGSPESSIVEYWIAVWGASMTDEWSIVREESKKEKEGKCRR